MMPWASLIMAVTNTLHPPRAEAAAPREPDLLEQALTMQATVCAQAAVFCPDPKEAARFFGDSINAQWKLFELNVRRSLEAYQPQTRRKPWASENLSANDSATPSANS